MKSVTINDIPDWFRIEKYIYSKSMSAYEWAVQLDSRLQCDNFLKAELPIDQFTKSIRENGKFSGKINKKVRSDKVSYSAVEHLSLGQLMHIQQAILTQIFVDDIDEAHKGHIDEDRYEANSYPRMVMRHFNKVFEKEKGHNQLYSDYEYYSDCPFNYILADSQDLNFTKQCFQIDILERDEVIIEGLKNNLKKIRNKLDVEHINFTDSKAAVWYENKILAYLDINIWGKENNLVITQTVLGNWLFPDSLEPAEKIRKGTLMQIKKIFNHDFITSLYAVAE